MLKASSDPLHPSQAVAGTSDQKISRKLTWFGGVKLDYFFGKDSCGVREALAQRRYNHDFSPPNLYSQGRIGRAEDVGEVNRMLGKSREHTARLMKTLFENGLVERDERNKPFVYRITEKGRKRLETASAG